MMPCRFFSIVRISGINSFSYKCSQSDAKLNSNQQILYRIATALAIRFRSNTYVPSRKLISHRNSRNLVKKEYLPISKTCALLSVMSAVPSLSITLNTHEVNSAQVEVKLTSHNSCEELCMYARLAFFVTVASGSAKRAANRAISGFGSASVAERNRVKSPSLLCCGEA